MPETGCTFHPAPVGMQSFKRGFKRPFKTKVFKCHRERQSLVIQGERRGGAGGKPLIHQGQEQLSGWQVKTTVVRTKAFLSEEEEKRKTSILATRM